MEFTEERLERYSRHILLENIGIEGQMKIFAGRVLIIGAGGLGAPAALYLAAAGVGTIGLVDPDEVDLSNLQRQVIHATSDIGKPKVDSARESMLAINPDLIVRTHHMAATASNIIGLINEYDFVIDGTDNFSAKFLINDACVMAKKPYSHGGILRFDGQTITYAPGHACYRCIFKDLPPANAIPTCSQAGVLGAIAGMLGTIQAAEALKFLTSAGTLLLDRLLVFDALDMKFRNVKINKNPACPVCGGNPSIKELQDYKQPVCELKK